MKRLWLVGLLLVSTVFAAEALPPKPTRYFNDYAGVVTAEVARSLDAKLVALEKSDSTQFVVVIYPKLDPEVSLEGYTHNLAKTWKVGQSKTNNGLILFFFVDDGTGHKLIRYEIGYGLEGRFTDATSKLIIENQIVPALKVNNWTAATTSGINSAVASIKGEYKAKAAVQPKPSSWAWKIYAAISVICIWGFFMIVAPGPTWALTDIIINLLLIIVSAGKSGSSGGGGFKGGGGSFGGGGSSGKA